MNPKILAILGGGALLYYLWGKQSPTPPVPLSPGASTGASSGPQPAITPVQPVSPAGTSQRQTIVNAINASGVSSTYIYGQQSADTWNWYAMQAYPGWTAPASETLFPGEPNVHTKTYTFDVWFGKVQPFLPASAGMSGYRPAFSSAYYGPGGWMA